MSIIFALMFQFVFWGIFVSIIVRAAKRIGKTQNKTSFPPVHKNESLNESKECLNEDIHKDDFHTYCDYCGASVDRGVKKCPSCGARIK